MVLSPTVVSKPAHKVLKELTGEERPDLALPLALKDMVRLRLEAADSRIATFEEKYGMGFAQFQEAWERGEIEAPYSYAVEKDYWQWEAAMTDKAKLEALQNSLI
jgi:hypothetical protein